MAKKQTPKHLTMKERFVVNLGVVMSVKKVTATEIMESMGLSRATYYDRYAHPYKFTMDNVERAAHRLRVAPEDMLCRVISAEEVVA